MIQTLIEQLKSWSAKEINVLAVALIGSWARGIARPDSDIDIVIITKDPNYLLENQNWLNFSAALPGCIILLPQSKVMADLMLRAQQELGKLGLTVDQLKSAVNQRSKSRLKSRYPGVFNDKT